MSPKKKPSPHLEEKPLVYKAIELPPDQKACIKCRFLSEYSSCNKGRKVDDDITIVNNGCTDFKDLLDLEF